MSVGQIAHSIVHVQIVDVNRVAIDRQGQPAVRLHQALRFLKRSENMAQGSIEEIKDRYPLFGFVAADPFQHPLQLAILCRMFKDFTVLINGCFRFIHFLVFEKAVFGFLFTGVKISVAVAHTLRGKNAGIEYQFPAEVDNFVHQ